ncbi:WG repeat-containing protein [Sediminibacterium ginsengisoli]|nr:WG repeat-containing protein [Sediminibacterium ginsengisoli]
MQQPAAQQTFSVGNKWGLKNAGGKVIVKPFYDAIYFPFSEGLVAVSLNRKQGYMNKAGVVTIPLKYTEAQGFSQGLAPVNIDADYENDIPGKWGFIDRTGKTVIPFVYDYALGFSENLAAVRLGEKWGYINRKNEIMIPFGFDDAQHFSCGLAPVLLPPAEGSLAGEWVYINTQGKTMIRNGYDEAKPFREGVAIVVKNDNWGLIDSTGKEILPLKYTYIEDMMNGIAYAFDGMNDYLVSRSGLVKKITEPEAEKRKQRKSRNRP